VNSYYNEDIGHKTNVIGVLGVTLNQTERTKMTR